MKCKGHRKLKLTQPPPRTDGSKGTKEICQRKKQKPLSQPVKTKLQDKKKQKRTLNEKRKMQSGTNPAVFPEEEIGRGTNIAPKAEIGTHGKRLMPMGKRRKLAAGARAKKRRERRKSVIKQMTNGDAQAARTGKTKIKMAKSERRKANKKTEAKKGPNNIRMGMKRKNQRRRKRRRMESSDVTDQEAEKRVAMHRGGPGRGAAANVANHVTEAATGVTAAAGTEDHLAGREAESETELGIGGEMQKTETRGRAQMRQRAKKPEDETGAPKNALPRKSEAERETIDRAVGRGKKRATVEAAIRRAMTINTRKEKGARVQNQKREQRTNLRVQEKKQRKRTPLLVTVTETLHVPLLFVVILFPHKHQRSAVQQMILTF